MASPAAMNAPSTQPAAPRDSTFHRVWGSSAEHFSLWSPRAGAQRTEEKDEQRLEKLKEHSLSDEARSPARPEGVRRGHCSEAGGGEERGMA